MRESAGLFPLKFQPPPVQLFVSLIIIFGVALVSLIIVLVSAKLIFGFGLNDIDLTSNMPGAGEIHYLKFVQTFQHLSLFMVPALIISYFMNGNISKYQGLDKMPGISVFLLVFILALVVIPVTGAAGILNSRMVLPDWMPGIEKWIEAKEQEASTITGWLITADSTGTLLVNIGVLALLPAIGEELLFRGIIQRIFVGWFRSGHLAVWLTSLLFSALHLQFFGFLPRLILGLIFGYLFLWSSTIWLPVVAHFINNLIPVFGAYIYGWERLNNEITGISIHNLWITLISTLIVLILMGIIRDWYKEKNRE